MVLGAEYAKQILNKSSALQTIRSLSTQAGKLFAAGDLKEYDDDMLKVDNVICDGDILEIGGLHIKVIETQGHTKCSLSFWLITKLYFQVNRQDA